MVVKNVLNDFNEIRALVYRRVNVNEITCRSNPVCAAYVSVRHLLYRGWINKGERQGIPKGSALRANARTRNILFGSLALGMLALGVDEILYSTCYGIKCLLLSA